MPLKSRFYDFTKLKTRYMVNDLVKITCEVPAGLDECYINPPKVKGRVGIVIEVQKFSTDERTEIVYTVRDICGGEYAFDESEIRSCNASEIADALKEMLNR